MVLEYYSQLNGMLFKKRPSGINTRLYRLQLSSRLARFPVNRVEFRDKLAYLSSVGVAEKNVFRGQRISRLLSAQSMLPAAFYEQTFGTPPIRLEAYMGDGRLVLKELDRLAKTRVDFAFESTLSGLGYLARLKRWKGNGYRVEIIYLRVSSPRLALRRIAARVKQGGHNVPRSDVLRRFSRSWSNFQNAYRLLADEWTVYDNSGASPRVLEQGP